MQTTAAKALSAKDAELGVKDAELLELRAQMAELLAVAAAKEVKAGDIVAMDTSVGEQEDEVRLSKPYEWQNSLKTSCICKTLNIFRLDRNYRNITGIAAVYLYFFE